MDALRRQLARHALSEAAQCKFAHRKRCRQRIALDACRGAGEEDRAAPLRKHSRRRLSRHEKPAIGADHDGSLDLGRHQLGHRTAGSGTGIVDDHIRRAGRRLHRREHLRHLAEVGCVASERLRAGLGAEGAEFFRVARRKRHPQALAGEQARQ